MDREQLVEAMAEAMSTDQLQRRGQRIVPWADEPEMWKNEQRARARAALAVAEPVVREWCAAELAKEGHHIAADLARTGGTP